MLVFDKADADYTYMKQNPSNAMILKTEHVITYIQNIIPQYVVAYIIPSQFQEQHNSERACTVLGVGTQ